MTANLLGRCWWCGAMCYDTLFEYLEKPTCEKCINKKEELRKRLDKEFRHLKKKSQEEKPCQD